MVPASYDETLDAATLPVDAVIVGSPAVQSFEVTPTNQAVTIDWLVDSSICHVASCGDGVVDDGRAVRRRQQRRRRRLLGDLHRRGPSRAAATATLDAGEQCDDGNNHDGDGCSANCTSEAGGEGCTPGYRSSPQHFDSYPDAYAPSTLFVDAFGVNAFPGRTLLYVLKQGGGGLIALGRHAVAALLNATSDGVDYDATPAGVIASFEEAYTSGSYEDMKDVFATFNELGCPLN